uniref:COP9 signalosome complex subunit 7 helix I domain-containing protein n=1 Tax=Glossina brevipalpis TaxID=37001 RepID=A0A1A9W8Y2_9MUSC
MHINRSENPSTSSATHCPLKAYKIAFSNKRISIGKSFHFDSRVIPGNTTRTDIIHGKIFQDHGFLEIDYAQGRDVPPGYISKIAKTLQDWVHSCEAIYNCLDAQIQIANAEKSKRLEKKKDIEQKIVNLKKVFKTSQISDNDDSMQIDARKTSATNPEVRKKSCRTIRPTDYFIVYLEDFKYF